MTKRKSAPVCRMTFDAYRQIEAVNWSTLREATRSGLAYHYRLIEPVQETDAMRLGRATHTAVFEPDRLLHEYVIWTGGRRAGKEWVDFANMHAGRTILKSDEYDTAVDIRDAVRGHKAAAKLLRTGQAECALTWTDEETGIDCKSRLDWLTAATLVDLKTTRDIEQRVFGRHAASLMYHCQMAFTVMGLRSYGHKVQVKIIAVEQEPPHDVAVYELDDDILWAGEVKVREALTMVAECRRTDKWPGRYPNALPLSLPAWEYPDDESDESIDVSDWPRLALPGRLP